LLRKLLLSAKCYTSYPPKRSFFHKKYIDVKHPLLYLKSFMQHSREGEKKRNAFSYEMKEKNRNGTDGDRAECRNGWGGTSKEIGLNQGRALLTG
jgi:hypothetical protein